MTYRISLHGICVEVETDSQQLLDWLAFDFAAFAQAGEPAVRLEARLGEAEPPAGLRESFRGVYGVCFDEPGVRHVIYPGPVWVRYDYRRQQLLLCGPEPTSLYERLYLVIHSRLGEILEDLGLHRVHGLGLQSPRGACLFLLSAGMGKSNLALGLGECRGWQLYSDDTPIYDRGGRLHPFPYRLGVRGPVAPELLQGKQTREHPEKTLVRACDLPLAAAAARCRHVFLARWTTGKRPALEAVGRSAALPILLRDGLVGLGVPQVLELFLRPGWRHRLAKAGVATSRFWALSRLLAGAECHRIYLSSSAEANVEFLSDWGSG